MEGESKPSAKTVHILVWMHGQTWPPYVGGVFRNKASAEKRRAELLDRHPDTWIGIEQVFVED